MGTTVKPPNTSPIGKISKRIGSDLSMLDLLLECPLLFLCNTFVCQCVVGQTPQI